MIYAYLSLSAGKVVIPQAVDAVILDSVVSFLDGGGKVLVTFRQEDLSLYCKDTDAIGALLAADGIAASTRA